MEAWSFDGEAVAKGFDSHIRSHLPWYDMMHDMVIHLVRNYITDNTNVVDFGASTGNLVDKLLILAETRDLGVIAVEKSFAMQSHMENRFGNLVDNDLLTITRNMFDIQTEKTDVFIACMTLSFINPSEREKIIDHMYKHAKRAVIIVDKVGDYQGYLSAVMRRMTIQMKLNAGVEPEEALLKEMSLSGVQVPLDPRTLGRGAKEFFRMGEFAGWIIEKDCI